MHRNTHAPETSHVGCSHNASFSVYLIFLNFFFTPHRLFGLCVTPCYTLDEMCYTLDEMCYTLDEMCYTLDEMCYTLDDHVQFNKSLLL